jgi:hypothetical protein
MQRMARAFERSILAALGLAMAAALAGCSSAAVIDQLPTNVGLPAGTPERPATPYLYPAVHDMPPPRATPTMTEEQQVKLEKELTVVRERQEARDGAAKKTGETAKKKPATADTGQDAGAKDGAKTNP